jgi:hypothetical protein
MRAKLPAKANDVDQTRADLFRSKAVQHDKETRRMADTVQLDAISNEGDERPTFWRVVFAPLPFVHKLLF